MRDDLRYDELKKLGLRDSTESRMRACPDKTHPRASGLLVVDQLIAGSHTNADETGENDENAAVDDGSGAIEPSSSREHEVKGRAYGLDVGDILITVDGVECACFVQLEAILDAAVGRNVTYRVERGGEELTFQTPVECLHSLTPDKILEASGAVFHEISFQQARNGNLTIGEGLYIAQAGFSLDFAGVAGHSVITKVAGKPTRSLEDLETALSSRADGETVAIRYFNIGDKHNLQVAMVRLNHRWFPSKVG